MKNKEINHFGDCSIYALNCDICDCGEFRRIMPDIDIVDDKTMEMLVKHQCQIREFAHDKIYVPLGTNPYVKTNLTAYRYLLKFLGLGKNQP